MCRMESRGSVGSFPTLRDSRGNGLSKKADRSSEAGGHSTNVYPPYCLAYLHLMALIVKFVVISYYLAC
jgi:hypothetical protein